MVLMELRNELNEDRIAPNMTAAKKPISGAGTICMIMVGYASSIMVISVPFSWNSA